MKPSKSESKRLGQWLRSLRKSRQLPLWSVASAAGMDSTLLSKIELGQRLPTEDQTRSFADFFKVSVEEMEARRLAERFLADCGDNPAIGKAVLLIREHASEYRTGSDEK